MLVFCVVEVSYHLLQYLPNRSQLLLILLVYKEHEMHEINGAYSVPDTILFARYAETLMCSYVGLHVDGILPKWPYPPCLRMANSALLAGYHRCVRDW